MNSYTNIRGPWPLPAPLSPPLRVPHPPRSLPASAACHRSASRSRCRTGAPHRRPFRCPRPRWRSRSGLAGRRNEGGPRAGVRDGGGPAPTPQHPATSAGCPSESGVGERKGLKVRYFLPCGVRGRRARAPPSRSTELEVEEIRRALQWRRTGRRREGRIGVVEEGPGPDQPTATH
ncbi:hypothetical protein PVAP13_9KG199485 [Panicum virgatum]|uniref:Uncharacterized protein n=1 Tax=Panicum virgatum TaxID=38727 RepID=A0A8T0NHJ1_PANVG|nr:hypothetical protein PVAP13_9KG199485 [Panicum virgatum]